MDEQLARTIINEFNVAVPEDQRVVVVENGDWVIGYAKGIVEDAKEAWREGMRGDTVRSILNLSKQTTPSAAISPYEDRIKAEARIAKEKLPVPPELEGDPPELPRDISSLSDVQLRRFHAEFHACLARTNWLVAIEETDEYCADQLMRHYKAMVLRDLVSNSPKDAKITALEAEAAQDHRVSKWLRKRNEHHVQVKLLKALRDTYEQSCDRMSRDFTMRQGEK